jgi:hypothetical protein
MEMSANQINTIGDLMVAPLNTQTFLDFEYASMYCKFLDIGGYQDWRLPTYPELCIIYKNKWMLGVCSTIHSTVRGSSYKDVFYSSDVYGAIYYEGKSLDDGTRIPVTKQTKLGVRAVRTIGDK